MHHPHIDKYGDLKSPIHGLDPRVKIICVITIVISVIFTDPRSFLAFFLYAGMLAGIAVLSRVPLSFIFRKSLVVIPFVLMIAVFIPFFKEGKIAGAYSFGTLRLTVTHEGLLIFWNVLVKSYLAASAIIIFTAATRFSVLLKALEKLKTPILFIMILSFMYRYLFVSVDELMHMSQAKKCRSVGGTRWFHAKTTANMIGSLFIRSYERGESVYMAMRSRGFNGTINTVYEFSLKTKDLFFMAAIVVSLTAIRLFAGNF